MALIENPEIYALFVGDIITNSFKNYHYATTH